MADTPLDFWNERFSGEEYRFGKEANAFLRRQSKHLRPGQKALAVADGEGRNGVWLAQQGLDVLSIDFSPVALAKAEKLAGERGVKLQTRIADIAEWPWQPAQFDVVAAIFIQFAPPDLRARIFAGIQRTLRPGGVLLLQGYRPKQLEYATGGPSQAENMYTTPMLQAAFSGMEILHLEERDEIIEEGAGHVGMSALIEIVARKH
jgi:SAM-dependent methyltransferase